MADNLGNEKVFENDKIIVWNFTLQPGEFTPHSMLMNARTCGMR